MRDWVRWSNRWMKEGKEVVSSPANRINTVKENRKMSITTNLQSTPWKELFKLPDKFPPVISLDDKSSKWTDYSIFTDLQEPLIEVYSKSSSSSETQFSIFWVLEKNTYISSDLIENDGLVHH